MGLYGAIIALTVFTLGVVLLLVRYPAARKFVPVVGSFFELVMITVDHWRLGYKYSDLAVYGSQWAGLVHTLSLEGTDLRGARKKVSVFVADLYNDYRPDTGGLTEEQARQVSAASYMALLSHEEILDTVKSLSDHKDLEVRKATLVAIDILGELFDLGDDLSQEYFQHLIYGINKCLVLLKKGGYDKRTLKKVTSTLWRVYKLTKAYKYLQGRKGLTKEEFYAKVSNVFGTLFRMVG